MTLLEDLVDEMRGGETLGGKFVRSVWPQGVPEAGKLSKGSHDGRASVVHDGILEVRTLITSSSSDTPAAGVFTSPDSPVMPTNVVPAVRMGDLFPRVPAHSGLVAYVRELNPASFEGGASAVSEANPKPEAEIDFEGGTLPVDKFAVSASITEQILSDAPGLRDFADRRMVDYLRVREEKLLLDGDGVSPNIKGLRQTSGVQTQAFSTSVANTIGLALAKVQKAYAPADSVVIGEDAFWPSFVAAPTFWAGLIESLGLRVLVLSSNVIGASKAMVGAFAAGAVIRERDTSLAISPDHGTNFLSNKITLRAERREAFIVNVPSWFCDTALA